LSFASLSRKLQFRPAGSDVDAHRAAVEEGVIAGAAAKPFRNAMLLGLVARAAGRAG
jgi:hypothetical protein